MHARRVLRHVAWLSGLALVALLVLPGIDALRAVRDWHASLPDPIPASREETQRIVASILAHAHYEGVPPPPPEPGAAAREEVERDLLVSTSTLCLSEQRSGTCSDAPLEDLRSTVPHAIAPRRLREELIVANGARVPLEVGGIAHARPVDDHEIGELLRLRGWEGFDERYPGVAGWVRISRPVLDRGSDGTLVYVEHLCGNVCGSGRLYLLVRAVDGWRIVDERIVWLS